MQIESERFSGPEVGRGAQLSCGSVPLASRWLRPTGSRGHSAPAAAVRGRRSPRALGPFSGRWRCPAVSAHAHSMAPAPSARAPCPAASAGNVHRHARLGTDSPDSRAAGSGPSARARRGTTGAAQRRSFHAEGSGPSRVASAVAAARRVARTWRLVACRAVSAIERRQRGWEAGCRA